MGDTTGIEWCDSTYNAWEGCTKVGPGCDHCYAEARDVRYHEGSHWGSGAPRRQMSLHTRNRPLRWQKDAAAFVAEHGHHQRVFCSSLSDIFDNEVDEAWRQDAFALMEATPDLRWQLCTKRVSNIHKMLPVGWAIGFWPRNVGVLITVVTVAEVLRDVPRLKELKRTYDIPWVGLSIEPLIEDVAGALGEAVDGEFVGHGIDWFIVGGESGPKSRPYNLSWASRIISLGKFLNVPVFHKQLGENVVDDRRADIATVPFRVTGKGKDMAEWPVDLRVRQFPAALQ
jgi:protein gp37